MMKKDLIGKKEEGRRQKAEGRRQKAEGKIWRCLSFKLLICPRLFLILLHTQIIIK
ncbi:MAG: hypothetical protein F6K39_26270 [Okeania sp. SIO3B3]|nr:hypothetical protein [Okeania sp. SIO3B3]